MEASLRLDYDSRGGKELLHGCCPHHSGKRPVVSIPEKPNLPNGVWQFLRDKDNALTMKLTTAKSHLAIAEKTASFTTNLRWSKASNFQDAKILGILWGFYWLYKETRTSWRKILSTLHLHLQIR